MEYGVEFAETMYTHPQFQPGIEDETFALLLQVLQVDDPDSIRQLHSIFELTAINPQRTPDDALQKAEALIAFSRAGSAPGDSATETSIIDQALDAADDIFFETLDAICESDFAEEHQWVQRLLSAILCRDMSVPAVHRNEMLKSSLQHLLQLAKTVIQKHPA